jgi:DNA invertase Pin-like site-specific DNA recombinase
MRAVIYAAKSTEDKHGSIPTQLDDCRVMAERQGWEVIAEHTDEAFSAYHGNRGDGLAAAKQTAIEHAPCILVAQDADRFARGAGDKPGAADHLGELFFAMRRQGVELWSVRSGKLDSIRAVLEGERSHDESARKAQAVRAGIDRRRAKGKAWGEPPLGYAIEKRVVDGEVVTRRVIDPATAPIIEAIYMELDTGASTGDVARKLNRAGHRSGRGKEFTARQVRRMAENADYTGSGPYPMLIDPDLWERVNDKIRRADPAAMQAAKAGRRPKADFMLRRLAFCACCGQPMYSLVRHGKRIYECRAGVRRTGTCDARAIPADVAEQRVLEHLTLFVGDVESWIGERLADRTDEQAQFQSAVDAEKAKLAVLDRTREQRMAELAAVGITALGLEVIERIDQERAHVATGIEDAEARLAEWTASLSADAVLDYYNGIVALVQGKVKQAAGVAEINAALHDGLVGVWLACDGEELSAEVRMLPTGDEDLDDVMAEMFGTLHPQPELIEAQLSGHAPSSW